MVTRRLAGVESFLGNLVLWQDPMWIGLFTYFSVTYIGGLTLVTVADVTDPALIST